PAGRLLMMDSWGTPYYWEYVATVTADYLAQYSYLVPTAEDSTPAGAPTTAFMVQARTGYGYHWESLARTGYSVDNLAPAMPAPFTGNYNSGAAHLHWNPNSEPDLAGYRLYRGASSGFVPGPGNLIAAPPDTGHTDTGPAGFFYKLTAVDEHGNESPAALLSPAATTAVGDDVQELAFAAPSPNPAGASTMLSYALPQPARVRLAVYDTEGRRVRELVNGDRPAGRQQSRWDLQDDSGRDVG